MTGKKKREGGGRGQNKTHMTLIRAFKIFIYKNKMYLKLIIIKRPTLTQMSNNMGKSEGGEKLEGTAVMPTI